MNGISRSFCRPLAYRTTSCGEFKRCLFFDLVYLPSTCLWAKMRLYFLFVLLFLTFPTFIYSNAIHFPAEKNLHNVKQLTFGGFNIRAQFRFNEIKFLTPSLVQTDVTLFSADGEKRINLTVFKFTALICADQTNRRFD